MNIKIREKNEIIIIQLCFMRKSKLNEMKLLKINTYFTETEPQVVSRRQ